MPIRAIIAKTPKSKDLKGLDTRAVKRETSVFWRFAARLL
jgi:hypothetical protein